MSHVINSRALTGEKPCINKIQGNSRTINARLRNFQYVRTGATDLLPLRICTAWPQNEHSQWKLRSRTIGEKAKQTSARNNAKCNKCCQILCNNRNMVFPCINIHQVPWEVLKIAASGLGFQHLPRDLANVNA